MALKTKIFKRGFLGADKEFNDFFEENSHYKIIDVKFSSSEGRESIMALYDDMDTESFHTIKTERNNNPILDNIVNMKSQTPITINFKDGKQMRAYEFILTDAPK